MTGITVDHTVMRLLKIVGVADYPDAKIYSENVEQSEFLIDYKDAFIWITCHEMTHEQIGGIDRRISWYTYEIKMHVRHPQTIHDFVDKIMDVFEDYKYSYPEGWNTASDGEYNSLLVHDVQYFVRPFRNQMMRRTLDAMIYLTLERIGLSI